MFINVSPDDRKCLSQEELKQIFHIELQCTTMAQYRERFRDALLLSEMLAKQELAALTEEAKGQESQTPDHLASFQERQKASRAVMRLGRMIVLAHRDAIMTVYHLHKILVGNFLSQVRKSPFLRSKLDIDKIKDARAPFLKNFPNPSALRNAVGHSAETIATTKSIEIHRGSNSLMLENMTDDGLVTMNEGVEYTFKLGAEELQAIDESIINLRQALILYPDDKRYVTLSQGPLWFDDAT